MKIKRVLTLDIDENFIKAAVFNVTEQKPEIVSAGSVKLEGSTVIEKGESLKTFLTKLNADTNWCIAALSRSHVTARILKLPSIDLNELQDMISFQTTKLVPFSKNEVILDYNVLQTTPEGFSIVHVLLCPKKLVQSILSLAIEAGLNVLSIRLNVQESAVFTGLEKRLIVEPDLNSTQFYVQENGKLLFARSVNIAKKDLALGSNETYHHFTDEIKNTFSLYDKETESGKINKIAFINFPNPEKFGSYLKENPGNLNSLAFDFKSVIYSGLEQAQQKFSNPLNEISLTALFGMASHIEKGEFNFLPSNLDKTLEKQIQQKNLFKLTLVAAGLIFLICGFLYYKNLELDRLITDLNKKTSETKSLSAELIQKERKIALVQEQQNPHPFALTVLSEIYRLIPKEVSLDSFVFDMDQGVYLKGTAFSLSDAVNLIPKFESSPLFETVTSKGTTTKKIKNKIYTDFQLELPFSVKEAANE